MKNSSVKHIGAVDQKRSRISLLGACSTLILTLLLSSAIFAQDLEGEETEHVFKNQRKNIVMLSFGYTYVPKGSALHEEESDGVFVPSIGLDYKRRLSEKWALSLFTDLELDHYLIIDEEFNREQGFIAVLGASYELAEGLGAFAGAGAEFEKNRNLFVMRAGLEYGFELGKHWILVPSVFFDWKETYETYSFSIGISRKF